MVSPLLPNNSKWTWDLSPPPPVIVSWGMKLKRWGGLDTFSSWAFPFQLSTHHYVSTRNWGYHVSLIMLKDVVTYPPLLMDVCVMKWPWNGRAKLSWAYAINILALLIVVKFACWRVLINPDNNPFNIPKLTTLITSLLTPKPPHAPANPNARPRNPNHRRSHLRAFRNNPLALNQPDITLHGHDGGGGGGVG